MGQRTLDFTKQLLRVFNLVELEELDLKTGGSPNLIIDSSKLGNGSQSIHDAKRIQTAHQILIVDSSKLGNGSQSIHDAKRIQTGTNKHIHA